MTYTAPVRDMRFVIHDIVGLGDISSLPGCEEITSDLVDAILEEAGKFAGSVLAPLNRSGDETGSIFDGEEVRTPEGFKEAYRQFVEGGWNSVPFTAEYGGQNLPWIITTPLNEFWNAANMSFALCPILNLGATELLSAHGSSEQKALYLERMISGEWAGTMNLTEPQSGSDLGTLKTRAIPEGGHYRITGQKIYITYGEHDLTENIIHMVLARTPDAPEGTRGISLFIVPKFLVNSDGSLGARNDLRCVSIEHKLGIKASPTAVMSYGDNGGAIGYLVGEKGHGLAYMFTMMNVERLGVGIQGVAIAEATYQQALAYARERVQSKPIDGSSPKPVTIIEHPDVRRMLMTMKSHAEAMRALAIEVAAAIDRAHRHPDTDVRTRNQAFVDLMIPVAKAWFTDVGVELASLNIQVHGGMGFIEETGAAQYYRDARIAPIYEGTNGIQANDLLGRKVIRDGGTAARAFLDRVEDTCVTLEGQNDPDIIAIRDALRDAANDLRQAIKYMLDTFPTSPNVAAAGAVPFLRMFGVVAGGWMMARGALAAGRKLAASDGDTEFLGARVKTARFFADHALPQTRALLPVVTRGGDSVMALAQSAL